MDSLLPSLKQYLPKLIEGIGAMSEHFHSGQYGEGEKLLVQVNEGLEWVMKAYTGIPGFEIEKIQGINAFLGEIVNALTVKDYVLIADLFEYEIKQALSEILVDMGRADLKNN